MLSLNSRAPREHASLHDKIARMLMRLLLTMALAACSLSVAFAQRGGAGPRGQQDEDGFSVGVPPGLNGGPGAGRPFTDNKLDRIGDMLRLSREQKNGAKEIFDAAHKEAAPLREEILKARSAIAVAILMQKSQQEQDQLLANYGNLMAQMTGIELRAFGKLVGSLKGDQQKRVGPVFGLMAGMFNNRSWNTTQ